MTTFIFCLIFIQVSIFLIAGIVIVSTFYVSLGTPATETEEPEPAALEETPASEGFHLTGNLLTRSELNYLLGI